MSVFITFDKAPWGPVGGYVEGDKPKYPLSSPGAWKPVEGMSTPKGEFYVTLGCPDKFDCIVYAMEVPSGVVVGYDRRSHDIIRPHRAGMGVVMDLGDFPTILEVFMAATDWKTVVSRVPDESFGEIREWRGGDYEPRDFMFTVDPGGKTDALLDFLKNNGVSFARPRGVRDRIEILKPNRNLIRMISAAGFRVWKDWSDADIYEEGVWNEKVRSDKP